MGTSLSHAIPLVSSAARQLRMTRDRLNLCIHYHRIPSFFTSKRSSLPGSSRANFAWGWLVIETPGASRTCVSSCYADDPVERESGFWCRSMANKGMGRSVCSSVALFIGHTTTSPKLDEYAPARGVFSTCGHRAFSPIQDPDGSGEVGIE
jgi:hypothetical protein